MLSATLQREIEAALSQKLKQHVTIETTVSVAGGCINNCYQIETKSGNFFVKTNSASLYPGMFEAEANGLELLSQNQVIYIPKIIACGKTQDEAFLLMEYIDSGKTSNNFWEDFGHSLAVLHRQQNDFFGLDHDNYIGSLPQSNKLNSNWVSFFVENRLEAQTKSARDAGKIDASTLRMFEKLYPQLEHIFPEEPPALLHGDLWSGNYMVSADGKACIIDPAVYYGHREMDIGMSSLFGGFDVAFYDSYNAAYPMESDWKTRLDVANLYPLMVHVNLFSGGYLSRVQGILKKFV